LEFALPDILKVFKHELQSHFLNSIRIKKYLLKFLLNGIHLYIIARPIKNSVMKYSEFHRKIVKNGWFFDHASGSHYFYKKDGVLSEPVPYHGSKEMSKLLVKKISKSMGIKKL